MTYPINRLQGFTLVELAIVLIIFSLLVGSMLITLSAQQDITSIKETEQRLNDIRDALVGYATAQRRLPCPASPGTTGIEDPPGGGACTNLHNGFVPGITLGISLLNAQGFAIDAWGNPVRYSVSNTNGNAFTTTNGMQTNWSAGLTPDIVVCNTAANISDPGTASATCPPADQLTNNAIAVVFSAGKNGNASPTTADELANWPTSNDRVFVNAPQGMSFDDLVLWLSPNILYNRLIAAGRLP